MKWSWIRGVGVCAPLLPVLWALAACGPSGDGRRVVLITIDTLRADHVGCYGSERARTPTLDGIARSGVRFANAIAPTPMTRPSHASILTGLDPTAHGVHDNARFGLGADVPTLAEQFGAAGFATAAFVASVVLERGSGLARGFDDYDDRMGPLTSDGRNRLAERSADRVVDSVLAWLDDAPDSFFLWVHFYDPHADYQPPAEYAPTEEPDFPLEERGFLRAISGYLQPSYAGEVAFADAQVGRLLAEIDRRWTTAGTLVAVTSDHGESLGEHGELTHSLTLYDATQRVPLLLAGPGVSPGHTVAAPVRLVDLAPTLLALAGIEALPGAAGRDLTALLEGAETAGQTAYLETLRPQLDYGWSPIYGLRDAQYKYLRSPIPELYDLRADPHELRNLAPERPDVVRALDAELDDQLADALELHPIASPDREQIALLESLGYAQRSSEAPVREIGWIGGADTKQRLPTVIALTEANWHLDHHRPERALAALASSPPANGWIALTRSRALLSLGRSAEAEALAAMMIAAQPDAAEGFVARGEALEALGRLDEAGGSFREAARIDPTIPAPRLGLGRIAEAQGDLEGAERAYREILESAAPIPDAALYLAALLYDRGRSDDAEEVLRGVGDAPGERPDAIIRLARAQAAAGHLREALIRLKRSIRSGPSSPRVRATFRALREQARAAGAVR